MFKVGDTIVYHDGKIYTICEEILKDYGMGPQKYFLLKQNEAYTEEKNTTVFAPVNKINDTSRGIMSKNEAKELLSELNDIKPVWINDSKQRKTKFGELAASKDPKNILKLIKSFEKRDKELEKQNKTLTITDKRMAEKLRMDLSIELSIALDIKLDEVPELVEKYL